MPASFDTPETKPLRTETAPDEHAFSRGGSASQAKEALPHILVASSHSIQLGEGSWAGMLAEVGRDTRQSAWTLSAF